jgi:hypothetical protein
LSVSGEKQEKTDMQGTFAAFQMLLAKTGEIIFVLFNLQATIINPQASRKRSSDLIEVISRDKI